MDFNKAKKIKPEDVQLGDLVLLDPDMMLIDPCGPVLVIDTNVAGLPELCEVQYMSGYQINVAIGMDIIGVVSSG
jgi:hypothetical protein